MLSVLFYRNKVFCTVMFYWLMSYEAVFAQFLGVFIVIDPIRFVV